ncbi:Tyrosine-protein kinase [Trema orientale]|uniref:Tyrosine-protein kinase n=1 Tax=Trema orientale TaxID=63057 RepID=A0A2P5FW65_TREOI|nr:Tyrosine-protein kinase [Trema orientale]
MLLTPPDCFSTRLRIHRPTLLFSTASSFNSLSRTRTSRFCKATLITNSDSFEVGRLIGSYGFMNVTSYSGFPSAADVEYSSGDMGQLRVQDVGEGSVKIRLYEGRVSQGPFRGTSVVFKVYPGQRAGGNEADMMAANELNAHSFLQSSSKGLCQNLLILLGGFETKTGEQWLAFRNDGKYSAADYTKYTSEKVSKKRALGEPMYWNRFEEEEAIKRRRNFVIKLFQGAMKGLAYMHEHERLHQSLGPSSIVLNTITEREAVYLIPRLRDLAFSVDIRYSYLEEAPGSSLSEGLWRRASAAGAFSPMEKRAFGIADDIYEAGLLFAYLAFVPFCESGLIDSLSLQRLLESTFQLDIEATREYCLADDRLSNAVKFLDLGDGAGWELLQAMLNPDFRRRPIAEAVLNHPFMTADFL